MTKLANTIATCAVVLGAAAIGAVSGRDGGVTDSQRAQEREAAFKRGGFQAAAALGGSYERTESSNAEFGPGTVEELVRSGEVIVLGRSLANRGVLAPSGNHIRTHYRVEVVRVLKGDALVAGRRQIVVSVTGGRANLGDGKWAQLNVRYAELPLNGRQYVFFLNRLPADARDHAKALDTEAADFWPARGFAGVVGLTADGRSLRPADRRRHGDRPVKDFMHDSEKFLNEVARIVRKGS